LRRCRVLFAKSAIIVCPHKYFFSQFSDNLSRFFGTSFMHLSTIEMYSSTRLSPPFRFAGNCVHFCEDMHNLEKITQHVIEPECNGSIVQTACPLRCLILEFSSQPNRCFRPKYKSPAQPVFSAKVQVEFSLFSLQTGLELKREQYSPGTWSWSSCLSPLLVPASKSTECLVCRDTQPPMLPALKIKHLLSSYAIRLFFEIQGVEQKV